VLSIDDAVYYGCQVAEALQHASHRGIVHRDIKPSNVLIDTDREVKLVDMGLARIDKMEMSQEDLTASGVTLGTFDYISPEQAKDPRAADLRSDIYSLGCTVYFMLTGQPPYPGGTMLQKLLSHGNAPPPDARHIRPSVSPELAAVIQRMLAKNPDDRYQNAADLITDLRVIAYRDGLSRSQGVVAAPTNQENPVVLWLAQNAPWLAATSLLLLVAAWLQLSSSASQDDFRLTAPSTARIATAVPDLNGGANQTLGNPPETGLFQAQSPIDGTTNESAASTQSDSTSIGLETDTATAALGSMGRASDPPSLPNLPQPDEYLSTNNTPAINNPAVRAFENDSPTNGSAPAVPTTSTTMDSVISQNMTGETQSEEGALPPFAATTPRIVRLVDTSQIIDAQGNIAERGDDGAALTTRLSEALNLARTFEIDRVELAVSQIDSEPIVIDRDGMSIVSTVGGTTIVFRSPEDDSQVQNQMIALGSNRVEFDDIHFVWDVEPARAQGGSLIELHSNRLLRLTDCSITIGNAIGVPSVYAFAVTKRIDFDALGDDEFTNSRSLPLVAIQMYNVIVRGQMSLIKMDFDAALQLQWENGLLAVSRRMIETTGATVKPSITSSPIELSLTRLTSHTPLGLLQMNLNPQTPFPAVINRDVTSCVFVVDEGASHIEVTGLETFDEASEFFKTRGEANAYDVDRVMLSLVDQGGNREQVTMRDLTARRPSWFDERSTRWTIWWKSDLHDDAESGLSESTSLTVVPPDQRTPIDYRQDGAVYSGFDEKSLPQLPFETDNTQLDSPGESGIRSGNR
jgi:serine/threonine-protein kinase